MSSAERRGYLSRMVNGDFDEAAEALYRSAGFSTSEQAPMLELAEQLLGDGSIRTAPPGVLATWGSIARVGTAWRIYLAADCPTTRRRFVVAHELSHWALGPTATEEECDRLAGALVLPRRAFLRCARRGPSLAVCRRFGVDHSCAWLRYGETVALEQGESLALVAPRSVRTRGAEYSWPEEHELRELVQARRAVGLRLCRVHDDLGRAVLRAC